MAAAVLCPLRAFVGNLVQPFLEPRSYVSGLRLVSDSARDKFADNVRVQVLGGRGGKGVVSFENITNWKRKPMGGTGGRGGDVIIEASATVRDLSLQTYVIRGRPGTDASGTGNNGRTGKSKKIMVPVGTLVKELRRTYVLNEGEAGDGLGPADEVDELPTSTRHSAPQHQPLPLDRQIVQFDKLRAVRSAGFDPASAASHAAVGPSPSSRRSSTSIMRVSKAGLPYREDVVVIADLDVSGQCVEVARGGAPGVGNRGSLLTYSEQRDENLKPHIGGQIGEARLLELELKTIADAGLVGFPNAGKSSLLGAVSRARPKVADYPFTTLHPTVGVVSFRDGATLTVADIPGLIEGAHADRGLGHAFLRHIERCPALLYVIDVSARNPDPAGDLAALQAELRLYDPALPMRPSMVVANKVDQGGSGRGLAAVRASTSLPVLETSALTGAGIGSLMAALRWLLDVARGEGQGQAQILAGAGAIQHGGAPSAHLLVPGASLA